MRNTNILLFLVLSAALLLASCAKEGPAGPTGPTGPNFTGSISGHVSLFDKYGSPILTGLNNVTLTLTTTGTSIITGPATMNPDSNGLYNGQASTKVTTGNYTIAASNNGFAATQVQNINFVSGTLNRDVKLSVIPDAFVTGFASYTNSGTLNDSLVIQATADARARNCIVFVNSTVSATSYLLRYIRQIPASVTTISLLIPQQDLIDAGFASGSKVYYSAYSYVVNDQSVYEDFSTGKNVYNAVNPVPLVDSALVP